MVAHSAPGRIAPWTADPAAPRLVRRGARLFRHAGPDADRIVALPDVLGPVCVLTPRGWGWPILARRTATGLCGLKHGEPCAPGRWAVAGGVAAVMRRVSAPRGPVRAEVGSPRPAGPVDGWLHLRLHDLAWAAARRTNPALGQGAVVIGGNRVRACSPEARARGIARGVSLPAAVRRCPGVHVVRADVGHAEVERLIAEVDGWLAMEVGGAERVRGGWRIAWSGARGAVGLAGAERLLRRLWQAFGVEGRAGVAGTAEGARSLAATMEPGWVAVAEVQADAVWARPAARRAEWASGRLGGVWRGEALHDVEGVVAHARALAVGPARAAEGGALDLTVVGEKGTARARVLIPLSAGASFAPGAVENAVRGLLLSLGGVQSIRVRARGRSVLGGSRGVLPARLARAALG